ncbi:MAG: hypothetical protein IKN55_06685 [Oscillospiraceae bacterium]|nr:hypothetical protein [Oscillospiraceae bacterium]
MDKIRKCSAVLCVIAVVLWFAAGFLMHWNTASAADAEGTLTLWCVKDEDIVDGMQWRIYRVGHRVKDDYVFEGAFQGYRATLGDKTKPMLDWDAKTVTDAGETLKYKTIVDKIPSRDEGKTDKSGAVTFSGLEDGLYLVWGDWLAKGNTVYIPSAIFFEVQGEDAAVLNAYPKIIVSTLSEEEVNYSVRKIWKNDESQPWNRSVTITVDRYCDGVFVDSVTLSEENDWTFSWKDTESHDWFVYERIIPANYTVAYEENHKQYLIVNTYEPEKDSSSTDTQTTQVTDDIHTDVQTTVATEDQSTETNVTVSTSTDAAQHTTDANGTTVRSTDETRTTTTTTTSTPTGTVTEEKAPQTGQLWWPVPILTGGGIVLLGLGMRLSKRDDDE